MNKLDSKCLRSKECSWCIQNLLVFEFDWFGLHEDWFFYGFRGGVWRSASEWAILTYTRNSEIKTLLRELWNGTKSIIYKYIFFSTDFWHHNLLKWHLPYATAARQTPLLPPLGLKFLITVSLIAGFARWICFHWKRRALCPSRRHHLAGPVRRTTNYQVID